MATKPMLSRSQSATDANPAADRTQLHPDATGERGGIQVIARAATILRALEGQSGGLSLGELAAAVGLARSTVQRIVKALADERLVMAAGPAGGVTLGPMIARLAAGISIDVVQIARPFLEKLSHELEETVDLSMIDGDDALFIDQVIGSQRLAAVSHVGERFPLHSAANGKALLTACRTHGGSQTEAYLDRMEKQASAGWRNAFANELDEIGRTLIAYDRDEHTVGVSAVGTWVRDAAGTPYALSIPVPSVRFDGGRKLIDPLLAIRREILSALAVEERGS